MGAEAMSVTISLADAKDLLAHFKTERDHWQNLFDLGTETDMPEHTKSTVAKKLYDAEMGALILENAIQGVEHG